MSDFDPGEGWREWTGEEPLAKERVMHQIEVGLTRYWVREEPVPPLPTEPYTVIRVTWRPDRTARNDVFMLLTDKHFNDSHWRGEGSVLHQKALAARITGFKVLAEPNETRFSERALRKAITEQVRHETAEAVANYLLSINGFAVSANMVRVAFGLDQ